MPEQIERWHHPDRPRWMRCRRIEEQRLESDTAPAEDDRGQDRRRIGRACLMHRERVFDFWLTAAVTVALFIPILGRVAAATG